MTGALKLADYPHDMVRIACRKCDRRGEYRRSSLIARYRDKAPPPDVLGQLAHVSRRRDRQRQLRGLLALSRLASAPVEEDIDCEEESPRRSGGNCGLINCLGRSIIGGHVAQFKPRQILGKWREGFALDLHTLSSIPLGENEFGHMQFATTRSEVGELLFKLKNRGDTSTVPELVAAVVTFMKTWKPPIDMIVPVPPSSSGRAVQPVMLLAQAITAQLQIALVEAVTKTRETSQLKNIFDLDERLKALEGVHAVDPAVARGRRILLFDDLFRSGATMNAVTAALYEQGKAAEVYALTITRTRSLQ